MSGSRDQNRIQLVDPDHATGAIRQLFAQIRTKVALIPNLFRVLANAPVALEGLMGLSAALARGALDEKIREQLALAIAESNLCAYCLNEHTAWPRKSGSVEPKSTMRFARARPTPEPMPSSNSRAASSCNAVNSPTLISRAPVQSVWMTVKSLRRLPTSR